MISQYLLDNFVDIAPRRAEDAVVAQITWTLGADFVLPIRCHSNGFKTPRTCRRFFPFVPVFELFLRWEHTEPLLCFSDSGQLKSKKYVALEISKPVEYGDLRMPISLRGVCARRKKHSPSKIVWT